MAKQIAQTIVEAGKKRPGRELPVEGPVLKSVHMVTHMAGRFSSCIPTRRHMYLRFRYI